MAHIEKYKADACPHMLAHYTRSKSSMGRENIDAARTPSNYTVHFRQGEDGEVRVCKVPDPAGWETVRERIEVVQEASGRKVRKDAVVMADVVVTAPQNVPEGDLERFFFATYRFMAEQVGRSNLMGGYVHMDETTPHMHCPFTPIVDGKFSYKTMCPRSFYQQFHKRLGGYLEKELGYRPEVELSEERAVEKALSPVAQKDLDAARAGIERACADKAAQLEAVTAKLELEQSRLELVRRAADAAAEDVEFLESVAADFREFEAVGRFGKGDVLRRIAERCDGYRAHLLDCCATVLAAARTLRDTVAEASESRLRLVAADIGGLFAYGGFPPLRAARLHERGSHGQEAWRPPRDPAAIRAAALGRTELARAARAGDPMRGLR